MLAKQDMTTLNDAGIEIDSLAAAAAAFIRAHPVDNLSPTVKVLSESEKEFLKQGGALGVDERDEESSTDNITTVAGEYAKMVLAGYSQVETAELLGVSASCVRQRIHDRSLYAIPGPAGRVCPDFQFVENGALPGLDEVLLAMSVEAHPVAVQRFFLGKNPELELETTGEILSPREWLMTGHPTKPIVMLAHEL